MMATILGKKKRMVCMAGLMLAPIMATGQEESSAAAPAAAAAKPVTITLPVTPHSGTAYPSMRPDSYIVVHLSGPDASVGSAIKKAEKAGWKCLDKASYAVTAQVVDSAGKLTPGKTLPIEGVAQWGKGSCTDAAPEPVALMLNASVDTTTQYVVSLVGLPDGMKAASAAVKFPMATLPSFSVLPSGVPGEAMTDGTTHDVGQLALTYTMPLVKGTPLFLNSTDVFSTDEKDTKSAFAATGGVGLGLSKSHYIPLQLSETIAGNQVATSLSAVSNLTVSGLVPWYWTRKALNNDWIDWGRSPEWALTASYSHRFDQLVTKKTKLLSVNDSAINPVLIVEPFYLLPKACAAWRKKIAATNAPGSRQYCLGLQMDLGTHYLPLDWTKAGSQQVDGYGDATILIPLTNMNFKDFPAAKADNLLNSQIQIEYSDSVNAANNYARTRVWTFGIAVMK